MKPPSNKPQGRGFALVVTLSLMILLTVIAVGLLGLASISLRTTHQGNAGSVARANARMALMIALGELQSKAGPDQRITAPANLSSPGHPMGLTGVWKSWRPDRFGTDASDYDKRKRGEHFLGYLLSDPESDASPDPARIPANGTMATLVGTGSLGRNPDGGMVSAPLVPTFAAGRPQGAYAWAVLDEGVKGRIDLQPATEAGSLGEQVTRLGSPARNRFRDVEGFDFLESGSKQQLRADLPKLVSLREAELASSAPEMVKEHFHDFTVSSASLQTNVVDGGLKKDLSVAFDAPYGSSLPKAYDKGHVYSGSDDPFPDSSSYADPSWAIYANHSRLYRLDSAKTGNPKDGVTASLPSTFRTRRVTDRATTPTIFRYEPDMRRVTEPLLLPTVAGIDMVFSLVTHNGHRGRSSATYPHMLHMMYLPVITLHNPYNTTLRCKDFKIEFAEVPVGFRFLVNGTATTTGSRLIPFGDLYSRGSTSKAFAVTLSTDLNSATELVMGPGETLIFGTPFPASDTWAKEVAANGDKAQGARMFDWGDNMTGDLKMIPGMITSPTDGIGFDVDWLAPRATMASWVKSRLDTIGRGSSDGVVLLQPGEQISVQFGPIPRTTSVNSFTMTTSLGTQTVGITQVVYKNESTLKGIMSEGVSPRFPDTREFPASFPGTGSPLTSASLFEADNTEFRRYANARPFAVFSMGAKTTVESFTKCRPFADTGVSFQMATCDFRSTSSQGSSQLEFALVPVKNGSSAIESGGPNNQNGFFFGGRGSTHGTSAASIYEIPVAPLQSVAEFRHLNTASIGVEPFVTYAVGESRAHPSIPSDRSFHERSRYQTLLDHSFLANSTLWDGYWFSTLATLEGAGYGGSSSKSRTRLAEEFFNGTTTLPNPRNRPYLGGGPAIPDEVAARVSAGEGESTAAHVVTEGGFNINSTSVDAWTAVLSSLAESDVPLASGGLERTDDHPFPRLRRPARGADADPRERLWNSYRTLDASQVRNLAENIVEEVRARGPFLSMAEFVNRRLGPPGELSQKGAIQAAIDKTDINSVMLGNARTITAAEVSPYGWENPQAAEGSTAAGAPGEISQGDVLTAIGSFVAARSDTFRIRAYGEARDSAGKTTAKAWCEAVVQRVPEYVDPADPPHAAATTPANLKFGRRFRVTGFRWLSSNEV